MFQQEEWLNRDRMTHIEQVHHHTHSQILVLAKMCHTPGNNPSKLLEKLCGTRLISISDACKYFEPNEPYIHTYMNLYIHMHMHFFQTAYISQSFSINTSMLEGEIAA